MRTIFKVFYESIIQAVQALNANRLRSFLSLLGITIGIFCIIGVLAAVDSLEDNVRGSINKLGDDVLYVQKMSWGEDPGANYFKYLRRPSVAHSEYEAIKEKVRNLDKVAYQVGVGGRTLKWRSNNVQGGYLLAVTPEYLDLMNFEFEAGRFFSPTEAAYGSPRIVIGFELAEALFGTVDPIGKEIKVGGRKMEVIGVLEKSGESIINIMDFDEVILCSYNYARKIANLKQNVFFSNSSVNIKAKEGVNLEDLKAEVRGVMRAERRLKPKEEDDFSINQLSIIANFLDGFFNVLNVMALIIGGFAILVGAFSVANIMFVSVKERTKLIGIKKALGAKRWVILLEFLIEAIILCVIGGAVGLGIIALALTILTQVIEFDLYLSAANMVQGLTLSVGIGIVAGMIPAIRASGMDPVNAMRH
ncbi:MAG TPA: ABC transporter permease [Saprospiraceae bacterium]|nr:ABC transporter permease [Saprospiraceae bacterium]